MEEKGIVANEGKNQSTLTVAEEKKLTSKLDRQEKEIKRLKHIIEIHLKSITEKDKEIASLTKQLEIERGNTFLKNKQDFARNRI